MTALSPLRPVPVPTPETEHFWEGTKLGELRLQRCDECGKVQFPPRPFCGHCGSRHVSVFVASGKATLHSYIINERSMPGFDAPYSIAVVKLEEGPTMMTNIVDCPQTSEALVLEMPLVATFRQLSDTIFLPLFRPEGAQS